ncbi:MAG: hypothetical protein Q9226_005030 [Calogaya cf. arnoldii]
MDDLDSKLDELGTKVDEIEAPGYSRLDETEKKFNAKFDEMESYFEDSRAICQNALCVQPWQRMKHVTGTYSWGRLNLSPHFSRTVRSFWQLKDPSNRDTLATLLRYYNVRGYQQWVIKTIPNTRTTS